MTSLKRYYLAVLLLTALLSAVLLSSCVNFDKSSIDDIPPLDFSEDEKIDDVESEPPTEDGYTARPTVSTVVNTSPEIVVISGSCEEGAVITATSPVDSVSVNSLNGYYILEYDLNGRDSRALSLTAKVEGKEVSTTRDITVKRDAMAETRADEYAVVLGKDGYLFFRETLESYCGENIVTVSKIDKLTSGTVNGQVTALQNKAGAGTVELIYVLLPNASYSYSDYLPEGTDRETYQTLYDQVAEALERSNATFFDMRKVFDEHKDDGYALFNKADSHMTDYAGYLVYSTIMEHIASNEEFAAAAPRPLSEFTISEETVLFGGDLAAYGQFDTETVVEKAVTLTPKFSMDMGDSAHPLRMTTTNLSDLQKYAEEGSNRIISGLASEGKVNILNRLNIRTEREELPCALIYRDDGSAMFIDYLAERFNNCMIGVNGDYVVNLTDSGRHTDEGKAVVDYVIVIVDENNLPQLVK